MIQITTKPINNVILSFSGVPSNVYGLVAHPEGTFSLPSWAFSQNGMEGREEERKRKEKKGRGEGGEREDESKKRWETNINNVGKLEVGSSHQFGYQIAGDSPTDITVFNASCTFNDDYYNIITLY